ncbi:DUF3592 domain-containing protein [Saxibacter everestensis]|uniref:DUF3592 domain-containing protein n=1 Tax=Saxibacter everestensis TaxID=2909229 RepID=A0ABY8QTZ6_9MICO|nr:DUF3592 domain-containing protein [Brevibacteriaceae bacterium ZFBP1038]
MEITAALLAIPAVVLTVGVLLVGWSLFESFCRCRAWKGWAAATGTVTGILPGPDGPSSGRHRFAPSYEFMDWSGARHPGQGDVFGPDQHIIGEPIRVLYNPANPVESALPGLPAARGRLSTGVILAAFGVAGLAMFRSFLP